MLFYTFILSFACVARLFTSCHSALNNNKAPVCGTIDLQSVHTLRTPSPSESYISPHSCFIFNIAPLTSSLLMPLPQIFMAQSTPPFSNKCLPESAPISLKPARLSAPRHINRAYYIDFCFLSFFWSICFLWWATYCGSTFHEWLLEKVRLASLFCLDPFGTGIGWWSAPQPPL